MAFAVMEQPAWHFGNCRNVDEYLAHVSRCIRLGLNFRKPSGAEEIAAMIEHFPDRAPRLSPDRLRDLGLSPFLRTGVPNLDQDWQEQFLATLATDDEFCGAVRAVLIGGVA